MSTFAVFGMTRDQALTEARKTVKTTRKTPKGEESLTMDEWTTLCEKRADEIMLGQKVKQLSPMFDAPQFAREFIEVARKTLKSRSLHIRFRAPLKDDTGRPIINRKTGAPPGSGGRTISMTKACWFVCLPCGKRFPMVGSHCDHDEALEYALGIWPHCWVE